MRRLRLLLPAVSLVAALVAGPGLPRALASSAPALSWSRSYGGWWDRSSSPVIADVNGDGVRDVVFGGQDGQLHVLDAATGNDLPRWPQPVIVRGGGVTAVDGTPAVADLDGDGGREIVVPAGSTWKANQPGGVVVLRSDGSVQCTFQTMDVSNIWTTSPVPDGYPDAVFSSPAIGDVDGDGHPDIVFGADDLRIHAIDRSCHELPGFPYYVEDSTWSSPALYDVDGDGRMEIFVGSDQSPGGYIDWAGGELRALDWRNGQVVELWKHQIHDVISSSPAIGDIDGDGRLEAVVGGGDFYHDPDGTRVYAWHLDDGSTVAGWPVTTGGVTFASPALGDLDGDGVADVAIGSRDGVVRAYRGNGQLLWAHQETFVGGAPGHAINGSPIIADVNGDGRNDVVEANDFASFALDGRTGSEIAELNTFYSSESAAALGDFGPLGWKLVTIGFDTPNVATRVQAFSVAPPGVTPPWPMFRKTPDHVAAPPSGGNPLPPGYCARNSNPPSTPSVASAHGYYVLAADGGVAALGGAPFLGSAAGRMNGASANGIFVTASGNGYYVVDSAGDVLTFGDAPSYGSTAGRRLNAPIISMAPTPTGRGYWLLASDGGVFSFGDAQFLGSTGAQPLNAPIISMAPTRTGRGYWLLASDGGVFTFGDAVFHGSTGALRLNAPVISMATAPGGAGYWLVARDGGVFSFGVPFHGSLPGIGICQPALTTQIRPTLTGDGYFVLAADGGVFTFGDAPFEGAWPGHTLFDAAVDLALRP